MESPKTVDMDKPRVFYDPLPGFIGTGMPAIQRIKRVTDSLIGQTMSLREAVARLRAVGAGNIDVIAERNYIRLSLTNGFGGVIEHMLCVIYYH